MLPTPHASTLATTEQRLKGRRWWPSLLLLLVAGAPSPLLPDPPGPVVVGKKGTVVAGDTLVYTISWGAGARATSYDISRSVTLTNGFWSVVGDSQAGALTRSTALPGTVPFPNTFSFTVGTLAHRMWVTAVPWDSATFTVTIASRNSIGVSAPVSATWRVLRKPGLPGPIVVDSSLIVLSVLVRPPNLGLVIAQQRRVCAYPQFWGGAVATITGAVGCDSLRLPLWAAASGKQQAHADSMCFLWTSTNPAVATIAAAPCALGLRPALIWRVAVR